MLLCAMLLTIGSAFAQVKVSGVVTDTKDGQPIPFASIVVKGTTTGTSADADGKYFVTVPNAKSVLVFSSIGYITQEVEANGRATINVILAPDSESLDEVMVVAYGTATKSSFTGSAGKVSGEKIEMIPATNPLNTLNGSTPGIRLTSALGQPGADASITVRGVGSLNGNTDPLIVLDGMAFSGVLSSIPAGDIESITVLKDAASTALYGARAANGVIMITTKQGKGEKPTITAKVSHGFVTREQKDYTRMNVQQYMESTWQQLYNDYKIGGASDDDARQKASQNVAAQHNYTDEYMAWKKTSDVNVNNIVGTDGKYNSKAELLWADDIDWEPSVEQVGQVQDYSLSISGRSKYATYFGTIGYVDQEGYMIGSGFERFSARANVSAQKDWFKMGVNMSAQVSTRYGIQSTSQGDMSNPFHTTKKIPPMYPIHLHYADGSYVTDANGDYIYNFGEGYTYNGQEIPAQAVFASSNAVKYCEARVNNQYRDIFNVKPYVEVTFLKDFKLSVNGALFNNDYQSHTATPYYEEKISGTTSTTITYVRIKEWTLNQLLTWNHAFGDHHVDALLGHEWSSYDYENVSSGMKNQIIIGDNYQFNNYTDLNATPEGYLNTSRHEGYFTRVNYDYLSKYFLSASYRRDASSKFASDVRWGNFWSVGGSWIISNEDFLKGNKFIDQLKLRASVGTVGSDDLGSYYPYMALYTLNQNGSEAGYTQSVTSTGNPNLQWEISTNWDAALEWAMFDRRFTGSLEYFYRKTSNLLMEVTLPSSTGLTSYNDNDGALLNHGIEFQLGYDIIKTKKMNWNLGVNGSIIKNKITYLPIPAFTKNSSYNKVEEGKSVHEWWLYQWEGVDPDTGLNLYLPGDVYYKTDADGNVTSEYIDNIANDANIVEKNGKYYTTDIAKAKEDYSGSSLPKIYGGITSAFRYGRFTFNIDFYYQLGGYTYDRTYANIMQPGTIATSKINMHTDMMKAWTPENTDTDVAMFTNSGAALGSSTYSANVAGTRSTRWLTSTNMLEINSMMLSYDFSKKACDYIHIAGLKAYVSADHLAVFNCRQGMFANYSSSNYDSGGSRYNPSRTITVGLNFTL